MKEVSEILEEVLSLRTTLIQTVRSCVELQIENTHLKEFNRGQVATLLAVIECLENIAEVPEVNAYSYREGHDS